MRVLVTGAAGFVGANLVRRLVQDKHKVYILQKQNSDIWRLKDLRSKIEFCKNSLLDKKGLFLLVKKIQPELIYHLAAHGSYSYQQDIDEMMSTNILGTLNLLLATKDLPYLCFVNTGSSSEYGIKKKPMFENDVCEPISFYAATKLSATVICQVFAKIYRKPIITLRLFSVYGQYEDKHRFVPTIINCLIENKIIKLTPGEQRRDFVYIDDVIDAYIKIPKVIPGLTEDLFNVGTGKQYTNDEVVKSLFKISQQKVAVLKGQYPARMWDTPCWVADISRTKAMVGWRPKFNLEKGLLKTLKWFKNNKDFYEK